MLSAVLAISEVLPAIDSEHFHAVQNALQKSRKPVLALPGLIKALERRDRQLLEPTLALIESLGSKARDAIPALKELLENSDPPVRSSATQALSRIDPEWMLKP